MLPHTDNKRNDREEAAIRQLLEQIAHRDRRIAWLQAERDRLIRHAEEQMTQEQAMSALSVQVAEKEQAMSALSVQVAEKEQAIATLKAQVAEKEQAMSALSVQVAEKEQAIATLKAQVAEKEQAIATLKAQVAEKEQAMSALSVQVAEKEQAIATLKAQVAEESRVIAARDEGITWLRDELAASQSEVQRLARSKFWRLGLTYWGLRERLLKATWPMRHPTKWLQRHNTYWRLRFRLMQTFARLLPRSVKSLIKQIIGWRPPPLPAVAMETSILVSEDQFGPNDFYATLTLLPQLSANQIEAVLDRPVDSQLIRRPDVICFSIIDWSFRYQRPQQIMSQFAAHGHRVFYINVTEFLPVNAQAKFSAHVIKDNVIEIRLSAQRPPDIYREIIQGNDLEALLNALDKLRRSYNINDAIGYVMKASWGHVALEARCRWGWRVLYDCMDEWENFPGIERTIVEFEPRLVQACDLLIVSAQRLFEKWRDYTHLPVLVRNGVDYAFYEQRLKPNDLLLAVKHPVVGYFGAIADWFDLDLMVYVAEQRPQYTFILLGGVFNVDVSRLSALPNVRLLGQQPYETMPQYLYHFDVCLIPFKVTPITEATDPVKLYEYLSAGKPVVSVALSELQPYRDHVYLASDREDFVAKLDLAAAESDPAQAARRQELARQNTWDKRYRTISSELARVVPRASIVVVTYNNLALTRLCLESVLRNTEYPNYEVIVVDNASSDGTPAYLRSMAEQYPHFNVVLNPDNYGFARANNQGMTQAVGDYLVLLNNDTIVPSGWLTRLLRHLMDTSVGIVGPVTNFVGNEAKVDVPYQTWREMERFACEHTWAYDGQIADIHMLAMYCLAMRREVYEAVGPLDEQFAVGMFEDDDYAMRVRQKGYRVVCASDVFVHHFGQAAFGKLIQDGTYNSLFEQNRRRYEIKWNTVWVPHHHGPLRLSERAPAGAGAATLPDPTEAASSRRPSAPERQALAVGDYAQQVVKEKEKWGRHLQVETSGEWNAWLDHPMIAAHYRERSLIDSLHWEEWVAKYLGGPAEKSLDLGCGAGERSLTVWRAGASKYVEGIDISDDRVAEGERRRQALGAPGRLWVGDINTVTLPENTYDLIFSCHSFHHFLNLEHVMTQVRRALTPRGLFVLEEFVGPTQFQWTDLQMKLARDLLRSLPEKLRVFRNGWIKLEEGRPTPEQVVAVSPFESIRSAEIWPIFKQHFHVVAVRKLGGTIQHLLYNGIVHNFRPDDQSAAQHIRTIYETEDRLLDSGRLPSDFMLLVGSRD
jgi:GT2 family glycosyltransferase/SAM-dependent methyltransferase/uncharacterized coiled-coil protein SlyX